LLLGRLQPRDPLEVNRRFEVAILQVEQLGGFSRSGALLQGLLRCRPCGCALTRLTADDRELLILRHLERLSDEEVAAILRIPEAEIQVRLLRALERLCDLLPGDNETVQ
jgi:hypothetical protein